ncbi:MAG: spermidine/putrescine ABC transporter substrate-binding protein [Deinococcales bacterium]
MRKIVFSLGLLVAFGVLALANTQRTLVLFNWADYMPPQIIKDFEKKYSATVKTPVFESNEELLAKLKQGGVAYDVIVPSDYIVPVMIKQGLLQRLDKTKIPNFKNLGAKFVNTAFDPKSEYTAGYQWGSTGIVYSKKAYPNPKKSWGLLFDPKQTKGNFALMNDQRVTIGAALKYLGKSLNTRNFADLKAAETLLTSAKKRSKGFVDGSSASKQVIAGTFSAAISYNGEANRYAAEDKNLGFFIPEEGTTFAQDVMAIPSSSKDPELAHLFINYILDAKVGAALSNYTAYASPNDAAKAGINKALTSNPAVYPPAAVLARLEPVQDLGADQKLYDTLWTRIKSR